MIDQDSELSSIIEELEQRQEPIDERTACAPLDQLARRLRENGQERSPATSAEQLAFGLSEEHRRGQGGGRCRYGPQHVVDGAVTGAMVDHWERRAIECPHPVMRFRYADLVWELSRKVRGSSAGLDTAHALISAALDTAISNRHRYPVHIVRNLSRALSVARSIRDDRLVERIQMALLKFMTEECEDHAPGAWGPAFDVMTDRSSPEELSRAAVRDLEARLARLVSAGEVSQPTLIDAVCLRLSRYHERVGQPDDTVRVLRHYVDLQLAFAESRPALAGAALLGRVYEVLEGFGARAEMDRIEPTMRRLQSDSVGEMQTFSQKVTIPRERIEAFLAELTEGTLDRALSRITGYFLQTRGEAEENERHVREAAPLSSIVTTELVQQDGRVAARLGSIDEDREGRLAHRIAQDIGFGAPFLRLTFEHMRSEKGLTAEALVDHLCASPLFPEERRRLLIKGVEAFFGEDYDAAVHLLVPQAEAAVRRLVGSTGGAVLRPRRGGGQHLRQLDELLRDEHAIGVLSLDTAFYLRVLLTDQRGWNLRNVVSHGLADSFGYEQADRLVHALLVLGALGEADEEDGG